MEEDSLIIGALQDVVLLQLQKRTSPGSELADSHQVRFVPTFVVLNAGGETLGQWIGFGSSEKWVATLNEIKADPVTVAERQARFNVSPTFRDAFALADFERSTGRYTEAVDHYRAAESLDGEAAWEADVPILIFRSVYYGAWEDQFTIEEVTALTSTILQAPRIKPKHALEIGERFASVNVIDRVGREQVVPFLSLVYRYVEGITEEDLQPRRQSFLAQHALYVEQDAEKAIRLQRASLPEGWETDADELNGYAWWCATRQVDLQEAEVLARRAIDLIEPSPLRANILDTLAEVFAARGDSAEARTLIEQALELDPENEYLVSRQEMFRGS